jgi:hypothetical protein
LKKLKGRFNLDFPVQSMISIWKVRVWFVLMINQNNSSDLQYKECLNLKFI